MINPPCEECKHRVVACFPDYEKGKPWNIMAKIMVAHHYLDIRPDTPGLYLQRCYALIAHWQAVHPHEWTELLLTGYND